MSHRLAPFAVLLLAACAPVPPSEGDPRPPAATSAALPAGEWQVIEIAGQPVPANVDVHIAFAEGRATGRSGCNRYMGPVEVGDEGIRFGPMAGTMMACVGPSEEVERAYLDLLPQIRAVAIQPDGMLVMTAADGRTIRATRRTPRAD